MRCQAVLVVTVCALDLKVIVHFQIMVQHQHGVLVINGDNIANRFVPGKFTLKFTALHGINYNIGTTVVD